MEKEGDKEVRTLILSPSFTIAERWRVSGPIGMGAFGEIYAGRDLATRRRVAIKVERHKEDGDSLKTETSALKRLQGLECVPQVFAAGRVDDIVYIVMELLGQNLADLRKKQPQALFSMRTVCRLACEMTKILQSVHSKGIVHRDVKPSNFVLAGRRAYRSGDVNRIMLIDYGLSRKYKDHKGRVRPCREKVGFRGTVRYASLNSHEGRDLGPVDDLWSLFFLLVEFATGTLPWKGERDKSTVYEMKKTALKGKRLVRGLPPEFEEFLDILTPLKYEDEPDYVRIICTFGSLLLRIEGVSPTLITPDLIRSVSSTSDLPQGAAPPYDWEAQQTGEEAEESPGVSSVSSSKAKERFARFTKLLSREKQFTVNAGASGKGSKRSSGIFAPSSRDGDFAVNDRSGFSRDDRSKKKEEGDGEEDSSKSEDIIAEFFPGAKLEVVQLGSGGKGKETKTKEVKGKEGEGDEDKKTGKEHESGGDSSDSLVIELPRKGKGGKKSKRDKEDCILM